MGDILLFSNYSEKKGVCGKPTSSEPGLCRKHSGTYYVTQYINRLRDKANANDLIQGITPIMSEESENTGDKALIFKPGDEIRPFNPESLTLVTFLKL